MGFHFIDQISAIDSDRARGLLRAAGDAALPPWLIIEGVGQLAAWIAMSRSDFAKRPVAALVGDIRLSGVEARGDIAFEARLERVDARAILYTGTAHCGGREIVALARCVGPLLPMDLFDDPAAMRARFAALRGDSTAARGLDLIDIARVQVAPIALGAGMATARLCVPLTAPFFADHFPRRPVYPASLLANALSQVAAPLAAQTLGVDPGQLRVSRLSDYKVRAFSPPGQLLDLSAERQDAVRAPHGIRVSANAEGKRVASGVLELCVAPHGNP